MKYFNNVPEYVTTRQRMRVLDAARHRDLCQLPWFTIYLFDIRDNISQTKEKKKKKRRRVERLRVRGYFREVELGRSDLKESLEPRA